MKSILLVVGLLLISCDNSSSQDDNLNSIEAEYVLPYPVGQAYYCSQGFNSSFSHHGSFKYSVDFDMQIGTLVTAARYGRVVHVVQNYSDNDHVIGHENVVIVLHEDTTYARYVHLTTGGVFVKTNQIVMPGDSIGLSGNSGASNHPHLHFDVTKTSTGRADQTIPFDFMNADPRPVGFNSGLFYKALSY